MREPRSPTQPPNRTRCHLSPRPLPRNREPFRPSCALSQLQGSLVACAAFAMPPDSRSTSVFAAISWFTEHEAAGVWQRLKQPRARGTKGWVSFHPCGAVRCGEGLIPRKQIYLLQRQLSLRTEYAFAIFQWLCTSSSCLAGFFLGFWTLIFRIPEAGGLTVDTVSGVFTKHFFSLHRQPCLL